MLIPAIIGGSAVNHLIDLNRLFIVTQKVKVFCLLLIIIGVKVAMNIFQQTISRSRGFL